MHFSQLKLEYMIKAFFNQVISCHIWSIGSLNVKLQLAFENGNHLWFNQLINQLWLKFNAKSVFTPQHLYIAQYTKMLSNY